MAQGARSYCSILAQEQGYDPIGSATPYDDLILIELPLPWAYHIWDSSHLPTDLTEFILAEAKARAYRLRLLFIAPEADYCQPGMLRVIHFQRPVGLATRFKRAEYSLPNGEMPGLVRAICSDAGSLAAWEGYRQAVPEEMRDIMVCTHGAVDVVCAKFGYPAYKLLRTHYANEHVRVWRVSHFGGHICAPTLLTFPDGRAWAYINAEQAPQLVLHSGEPHDLYGNYRGWATLPRPFVQIVEREVWMHEGWAWLACQADGEVLAAHQPEVEGEKPAWAEVLLRYERPDGRRGHYRGRVELSRTLNLYGSTKSEHPHLFAQYQVVSLEHTEEAVAEFVPTTILESVALLQLEGSPV
jgi:hypothetical protein